MNTTTQRHAGHPRDSKRRGGKHATTAHQDGVSQGANTGRRGTARRTVPGSAVRTTARTGQPPAQRRYERIARQQRIRLLLKVGGTIIAGVIVLAVVYLVNTRAGSSAQPGQAGQYRFDVASPATGALAPEFTLPSTAGSTVRLSDYRGKSVLLYFQEGLGCEGCWTQMKDIQGDMREFNGLGIDTMLTITTNPLSALKQKAADERLTLPVLSDSSFAVSRAYNATRYGMMAGSADGHTFLLVGPDGRIRWRADYGGPPNYTMYVPVSNLIADIKAGMKAGANGK